MYRGTGQYFKEERIKSFFKVREDLRLKSGSHVDCIDCDKLQFQERNLTLSKLT